MKNQRLQNYYECIGCGNCVDVTVQRGKCEICGSQKWIAKTTYTIDKTESHKYLEDFDKIRRSKVERAAGKKFTDLQWKEYKKMTQIKNKSSL